jgi:hypothetical protein
MNEGAKSLVAALGEAVTVFEEQGRHAEQARDEAEAIHTRFTRVLERYQASGGAEPTVDPRAQWLSGAGGSRSLEAVQEQVRESTRLSARWEQAFCDSYEALMRLYAHPEARASAERIATLLRTVRLLQFETQPCDPPPFQLSGAAADSEAETTPERKRRMASMALDFFGGMDAWHEKVQDTWQEQAERTASLLREALSEAQIIADHTRCGDGY